MEEAREGEVRLRRGEGGAIPASAVPPQSCWGSGAEEPSSHGPWCWSGGRASPGSYLQRPPGAPGLPLCALAQVSLTASGERAPVLTDAWAPAPLCCFPHQVLNFLCVNIITIAKGLSKVISLLGASEFWLHWETRSYVLGRVGISGVCSRLAAKAGGTGSS